MLVKFYDSWEEMIEDEDRARKEADRRTKDWQKKVKPGDYFVTDSGYGFPIFGKVLEKYKEKELDNYRFCDCYSSACPEGEKGGVHVSTILSVINEEIFEFYRKREWLPD